MGRATGACIVSAWRLAVRALYDMGGKGKSGDIQRAVAADFNATSGLAEAAEIGLVTSPGRVGRFGASVWRITPLGEEFVEGLIVSIHPPRTREAR